MFSDIIRLFSSTIFRALATFSSVTAVGCRSQRGSSFKSLWTTWALNFQIVLPLQRSVVRSSPLGWFLNFEVIESHSSGLLTWLIHYRFKESQHEMKKLWSRFKATMNFWKFLHRLALLVFDRRKGLSLRGGFQELSVTLLWTINSCSLITFHF